MIRLKPILEQLVELPKVYAYNNNIVIQDRETYDYYTFKLEAGAFNKDIDVKFIDIKTKKINYIHPLKGFQTATLRGSDITLIAKQYKNIEVGDSITGLETPDGTSIQLTRIK
jgi:hypothetical protein